MIVGITGPISSGKGKVAEFFMRKGFTHHSFSAEIREIAKERSIKINRKNLSKLGADLREESPKKSILGQRLLETIKKEIKRGKKKFVLEGIRDVDEIKMFQDYEKENKKMPFVLIGVNAPQKTRFERLRSRARQGDTKTFAAFKRIDDKETLGSGGQEVGKCMRMVDYLIKNDGTTQELKRKVERIIKKMVFV
ncbi:AAA family ATPase [Candidatus Woesearchaeota archaeon]|nr:AAA family ATPase [Candidatus Woesearchaeota archaeon]